MSNSTEGDREKVRALIEQEVRAAEAAEIGAGDGALAEYRHAHGLDLSDDDRAKWVKLRHGSNAARRLEAEEERAALAGLVSTSGFTAEELREQARRDDFVSLRARVAWIALCAIEGPAA